jgi:hypothetical protein
VSRGGIDYSSSRNILKALTRFADALNVNKRRIKHISFLDLSYLKK